MRFLKTITAEFLLQPFWSYVVGYCLWLLGMLLLGDGKLMTIDVFGVEGVLIALAIITRYGKKRRELEPAQGILWVSLLSYSLIRTFFSDDVGHSIFTVVRYIDAFLLYYLFYCYSTSEHLVYIVRGLFITAGIAVALAISFIIAPWGREFVPAMNLVYLAYGHNHIVDLLLLVYPVSLLLWYRTKNKLYGWTTALCVVGFVLSFARAAAVFVTLFTLGFWILRWIQEKRINKPLGAFLAIGGLFVGILLIFPYNNISHKLPQQLFPSYSKSPLGSDGRFEYWRQGLSAFYNRPVFGNGPGTFFLQSKKMQNAPGGYSWYAHSFFIETLAEIGIVGITLWVGILFYLAYSLLNSYKGVFGSSIHATIRNGLLCGAALVFVYSFIDIPLNFLVVWLLFWVILGVVHGASAQEKASRSTSPAVYFFVLLLILFGLVDMFKGVYGNASLLYVYDDRSAISMLNHKVENKQSISPLEMRLVTFFHKRNADVLIVLAMLLDGERDTSGAHRLFKEVVSQEMKNQEYHKTYSSFLIRHHLYDDLLQWYTQYHESFLPPKYQKIFIQEGKISPEEAPLLTDISILFDDSLIHEIRFARFYYTYGLSQLETNPEKALRYWQAVKGFLPDTGYIYLEIASIYKHKLRLGDKAFAILSECSNNPKSQIICGDQSLQNLQPGAFSHQLSNFPYEGE